MGLPSAQHPVAPNDLVDLEVGEEPFAGRYASRVEGIAGEVLALAAPLHHGTPLALPLGSAVLVHVLKPDPVRGARYVARGQVVGRQYEGQVPLLLVGELQWERVQLRSFTRAPAIVPIMYRPVGSERRQPWNRAETRDLGGGGLMFWTKQPPQPGSQLEMVIELPQRSVEATGEVIRVQERPEEEGGGFGVAVRFVSVSEADRDRLIRFVLRRQAEMRRMGLI